MPDRRHDHVLDPVKNAVEDPKHHAELDPNGQGSRWQRVAQSMRFRIIAAAVLLLVLASAVSLVLLRQVLFAGLNDGIQQSLDREYQEFLRLQEGVDPRTGEAFGDDYAALFDVYFAREVPDEGETLLSFLDGEIYTTERARDAATDDQLAELFAYWLTRDDPTAGTAYTAVGDVRYIAHPLSSERGNALFVVANFPAYERAEITSAVGAAAAIQLVTLIFAGLLGLLLADRVLKPLRSLAITARTINDTDLTRRIAVVGRDEASQIAQTFNEMLARLELTFAQQRQFLDDVGHELRTPLQIISGHVELLHLDEDPVQRADTVELVLDEVARMNRMVNELLLLARAEQPDFCVLAPVEVDVLTGDVLRKAMALGERRWVLDGVARAVVLADEERLTQALLQLAENAVRYTAAGAEIWVGSAADDEAVRLWVEDSGAGVLPEEADRIFERFARGSVRAEGGVGLGLSIVRAIVAAHLGSVRVTSGRTGGARFEITLPRQRG